MYKGDISESIKIIKRKENFAVNRKRIILKGNFHAANKAHRSKTVQEEIHFQ